MYNRFDPTVPRPPVGTRIGVGFEDQPNSSSGVVTHLRDHRCGVKVKFDDNAHWWMNLDTSLPGKSKGNEWFVLTTCGWCKDELPLELAIKCAVPKCSVPLECAYNVH